MSEHKKKHDNENTDFSKLLNNIDINELMNAFGSMDFSKDNGNVIQGKKGKKGIEVLNAVKPLVDSQRSQIIDTIIQLYYIKKIISG